MNVSPTLGSLRSTLSPTTHLQRFAASGSGYGPSSPDRLDLTLDPFPRMDQLPVELASREEFSPYFQGHVSRVEEAVKRTDSPEAAMALAVRRASGMDRPVGFFDLREAKKLFERADRLGHEQGDYRFAYYRALFLFEQLEKWPLVSKLIEPLTGSYREVKSLCADVTNHLSDQDQIEFDRANALYQKLHCEPYSIP